MAEALKILGQAQPSAANTASTLYTAPTSPATSAVVSSLVVANVTANSAKVRVFVRSSAGAVDTPQAIAYDVTVAANSTLALTLGITLQPGAVLSVASGTASALTFTAFGQEIS